jgi:hypothetical protein
LTLPHFSGSRLRGESSYSGPTPPASRWKSTTTNAHDAVQERFSHLVEGALSSARGEMRVMRPSGVSNAVLTESLRKFVAISPGSPAIELQVEYRDGSRGPAFILRSTPLRDRPISSEWNQLRFALLSVRHVELDEIVHGAWLRNSRISRPRPMGDTDTLVFELSRRQLRALDTKKPTLIYMYQTGLEPAIVGFYRAVAHHLREYPGSVAVIPRFFVGEGRYSDGMIWTT